MSKQYSPEQKKKYFERLRAIWQEAKDMSINEKLAISAIILKLELQVSATSFAVVKKQMDKLGLKGMPYIDMKTFQGWGANGFMVKKGQQSKVTGIVWLGAEENNNNTNKDKKDNSGRRWPKEYKLFHRDQVKIRQ